MTVTQLSHVLVWSGVAVIVLLAVGWYLSYTAVRLDRLHHRMQATAMALDAQLVRRAEATLEAGLGGSLDPASSALLVGAASEALETPGPWSQERQRAETGLTEVLRATGPALDAVATEAGEEVARLRGAAVRVQYARRFHNDAVEEVLRLRRQPQVHWFRLAGYASAPVRVEFDDRWPPHTMD